MDHLEMRRWIMNELRADLWGPSEQGDVENIRESPTTKYLVGILYPGGEVSEIDNESGLDSENDSDEDVYGVSIGDTSNQYIATATPTHLMKPSSMGITCELAADMTEVEYVVNYGIYYKSGSQFTRVPVRKTGTLDITQQTGSYIIGGEDGFCKPVSEIKWLCRRSDERVILTVFLLNREKVETYAEDSKLCMFQCSLQLKGRGDERPFIARKVKGTAAGSVDGELIFRKYHEFAIGHGCSVKWNETFDDRTDFISTTFLPTVELATMQHLEMGELGMGSFYASNSPEECASRLSILADRYQDWIQLCSDEIPDLEPPLRGIARKNIDHCIKTLNRIREGIALLETNQQVFRAFCFADRAMQLQRAHSLWSLQHRKGLAKGTLPEMNGHYWRPFQMGFILSNLAGIIEPEHPDRAVVDLLWFPTGGGKTEAYLGLAAFSMAYRRLAFPENFEGVDIIMRYTLRLLSNQQFQRAATLICACEAIRKETLELWGEEPFLIGLWLGMSTSPNTMKDAKEALKELNENPEKTVFERGNPIQLLACPWCGEELTIEDYSVDEKRDWLLIHCPRKGCLFHDPQRRWETSIPVLLVDENIYRRLPSLLIGTVDKFARLPWEPRIGSLFGHINRYCTGHGWLAPADKHPSKRCRGNQIKHLDHELVPPTLIIQDELHLVSGPLGTMMGLYETAVDILCCNPERPGNNAPKVIASTATIKGADAQVNGLFAREVVQFPPNGLDIDDNFFARTVKPSEYPGRLYAGIFAPGRSVKTALLRVYSVIMNTVHKARLQNVDDAILDPYWTLIGYFNSIRELGGARRLVEDDIPKRLEYLAASGKTKRRFTLNRKVVHYDEITSRKKSQEIPQLLEKMERTLNSGQAMDVILASNMISVGMDVDRLGVMVVNGQPKSTAEYIQASSRIGRQFPGLVVTVYNWSRPRDISHFERFMAYHQVYYKFVEPTSVTPYSSRARDRALHAVLVGLCRVLIPNLADSDSAGNIVNFNIEKAPLKNILEMIMERGAYIRQYEPDKIKMELIDLVETWQNRGHQEGRISFAPPLYRQRGRSYIYLLKHAGDDYEKAWLTPDSMRSVEKESTLYYCD